MTQEEKEKITKFLKANLHTHTDWTGAYPKSQYGFDNPIDACYEMIVWLKENRKI